MPTVDAMDVIRYLAIGFFFGFVTALLWVWWSVKKEGFASVFGAKDEQN